MTIIAATTKCIGCDTQGTSNVKENYGTKIISFGTGYMGYSGTYLLDRWAREKMPRNMISHKDIEKAWDKWFVFKKDKSHDEENEGCALFLTKRGLFIAYQNNIVLQPSNEIAAIGSGKELALGALYALNEYDIKEKEKIKLAINAAKYYNPYCGGDTLIYEIE